MDNSFNLLQSLSLVRGEHTGLVSVLIPANTNDISSYSQLISSELATAVNIKDKNNRKNVLSSLKCLSERLKTYRSVPETGLAMYAGYCV